MRWANRRNSKLDRRANGEIVIEAPFDGVIPRCLTEHLVRWAATAPDRVFLGERVGNEWKTVSYAEALRRVERIAAALLQYDLSVERPVLVLSDNSVRFALLALAAMHIGVPIASCSPAYSLLSTDFAKLRHVVDLITPGIIFAESGKAYQCALQTVDFGTAKIVVGTDSIDRSISFDELEAQQNPVAVAAAYAKVDHDTIAKFLFTSGSTGVPKAVINTQRMLCSNQEAKVRNWTFVDDEPPVVVDWLPWNHTFGANYVFNMVLRNGGTLYVDPGRPSPAGVKGTVDSLKKFSPTAYYNVPRGFDMLLPHLENDAELRDSFLKDLRVICYAGAALPPAIRERLLRIAAQAPRKVALVSSWGSTETAPGTTSCYGQPEEPAAIGLPLPGVSLKLTPNGSKLEVRIRGLNVTPGYWRQPELTEAAFDSEGFYKVGDAMRLVDLNKPELGLVFDGRVAENFKLSTGTWVSVGALRVALVSACAPIVQDAVITGHNRDDIGALLFLNNEACRAHLGGSAPAETEQYAVNSRIRKAIAEGIRSLNRNATGSSQAVLKATILIEPPSLDAGEITDKGYINQRAVLDRRADIVNQLYQEPSSETTIVIGD